jgi:sugar-specific transcriptional regulator TrmB
MTQELVRSLQALDLTEYEAKVYIALLGEQASSGYAVARISGVPRSRVYEVLGNLVERGIVLTSNGDPVQYAALPPQELLARWRKEVDAALTIAESGLEAIVATSTDRNLIWDLSGREAILERVRDVINRTGHRLLMQLWAEDAPAIEPQLRAASARGVEVMIVAYDDPGFDFGKVYLHEPGADEIVAEHGGRWIILSADAREVVAGIVSLGEGSRAAWTSHPGLAMPITEEIKHDIYLAELLDAHREALEATFGPSLIALRKRFSSARGLIDQPS